jgi:arylsulfatase A-like enzyme
MATCIDLSGATYPDHFNGHKIRPMEGQSLVTSFKSNIKKDRLLLWEHYQNAAIRQGKWKLVKLKRDEWELYDMENDRSEHNNLAKTPPEKPEALEALWEKNARRTLIYPRP